MHSTGESDYLPATERVWSRFFNRLGNQHGFPYNDYQADRQALRLRHSGAGIIIISQPESHVNHYSCSVCVLYFVSLASAEVFIRPAWHGFLYT